MKISIAVTTCEADTNYWHNLRANLTAFIRKMSKYQVSANTYEIIILSDTNNEISPVEKWTDGGADFIGGSHPLNKDFATHKNYMNSMCTGDWIFHLDADERINEGFLFNIPALIESNPEAEAYWLPRVNTVHGLTLAHVAKWHWILTSMPEFIAGEMLDPKGEEYRLLKEYNYIISEENGVVTYHRPIIMWPDYQCRLYKNDPKIKWERPVHEQLVGYENYTRFPANPDFAIEHHKDIKRQERQNSLYETIQNTK